MDDYQKSLLYLSFVVMYTDGVIHNQGDTLLKKIFQIEQIPDGLLVKLNEDVKKKSLNELRKTGLEGLMNAHRKDQIKTLAWLHKMIHADHKVNIKEAQYLMSTIKPTDISYNELVKVAENLPMI